MLRRKVLIEGSERDRDLLCSVVAVAAALVLAGMAQAHSAQSLFDRSRGVILGDVPTTSHVHDAAERAAAADGDADLPRPGRARAPGGATLADAVADLAWRGKVSHELKALFGARQGD